MFRNNRRKTGRKSTLDKYMINKYYKHSKVLSFQYVFMYIYLTTFVSLNL